MAKKASGKTSVKKAAAKGGAVLLKSREIGAQQQTFSHPWNPNSEITGVMLGRVSGLKRVGVSIARLAPGKESFVPHAHQREEEWLYILAGQGLSWVDGKETPVTAGDFLAFPNPQAAHHLKNAGPDDLVYLMGGENLDSDVVDFPTLKRRMVRVGENITVYDAAAGKPFAVAKSLTPSKKKSKKR